MLESHSYAGVTEAGSPGHGVCLSLSLLSTHAQAPWLLPGSPQGPDKEACYKSAGMHRFEVKAVKNLAEYFSTCISLNLDPGGECY